MESSQGFISKSLARCSGRYGLLASSESTFSDSRMKNLFWIFPVSFQSWELPLAVMCLNSAWL